MNQYVGDDIIDLKELGVLNRHKNSRYLKRVCTDKEREYIKNSSEPEIVPSMFWSAKESAYKIVKKIVPSLVFSPCIFDVQTDEIVQTSKDCYFGVVKFDSFSIPLRWELTSDYIYCLATFCFQRSDESSTVLYHKNCRLSEVDSTLFVFTKEESNSIYSDHSMKVRLLAKSILAKNNYSDIEIIRQSRGRKFGPPEIWQNRVHKNEWDISMSHDGRYLSCAVSISDMRIKAC